MDPVTIALAGAGTQLLGSVFGGFSQQREARKQQRYLDEQRKKHDQYFQKEMNIDPTQRAGNRRMLTLLEDTLRKRSLDAQGTAVTGGLSEEQVAAQKAANNAIAADVTSSIVAQNDARRDALAAEDRGFQDQTTQMQMGLSQQRQGNIASALSGLSAATNFLTTVPNKPKA